MDIWIWPLDTTKTAVKELEMEGGVSRGGTFAASADCSFAVFIFTFTFFSLTFVVVDYFYKSH